ncbi:efflux RND transporter periplasmic adaptor subunit [Amphritea opalescens]|uniref:Efflux RND transporter periplasmic adaptor subunit n=1 Tax=Amphritea opalescens TaxID=2490544 RepID=A0A430KLD3_9GAMM|nr:efflux RND transporter periplasmic adaptor subunit [Amphritea opalescens]RTE64288.1 efflux RND transporter periplasmic adaptor subunit [Amphritea opalescens]
MKKISYTLSAVALAALLTGCEQPSAQQVQQPPLTIDVADVQVKQVQTWHTFTTRLEAPQRVVLKPRVSGQIDEVLFQEGERVQQGQVLFSIDSRPFKAQVDSLEAQLASAKAALEQAKGESKRAKRLLAKNAMSAEQADQRDATLRQAIAGRNAIIAQLQSAKLDLEFSQVEAPISGIISRAIATQGNFVTAGQTTLTTLVSNDKVYAYFDIDERTWNDYFIDVKAQDHLGVSLESVSAHQPVRGYVDFIDNEINPTTGTLRIRGVFDAQQYNLKPGAFARVSLAAQDAKSMAIVPERAIGTDLKNRFVLVVDSNNTLQYRLVELGDRYGAYRAITAGLEQGDRVAANGPARVGPGMPITPNEVSFDFANTQFVLNQKPSSTTLLSVAP